MSRIAYCAGRYTRHLDAVVSIDDRGFQFGDGVYEGLAVYKGQIIDIEPHQARLFRSLAELDMDPPMSDDAMRVVYQQVIKKNHVYNGFLYIQITRGVAKRDHAFPKASLPTLVVTCRPQDYQAIRKRALGGAKAVTGQDERWGRCDIKSINLLPNVLGKQKARAAGAFETIMLDGDGMVTEGTSSNTWVVKDNTLYTRSIDDNILAGVTRMTVLSLAEELQMKIVKLPVSLDELFAADEVFLTGTSSCVMPITEVDGKQIGSGKPGSIGLKLIERYFDYMDKAA